MSFHKLEINLRVIIACHPEAGEARRGTSRAINRFREAVDDYVRAAFFPTCVNAIYNCEVPRRLRGSG